MANTVSIEVVSQAATKAGVSVLKLEQKLEKLERRLARLGRMTVMPEIGADVSGFYGKMNGIDKRLDKLENRRAKVRLDAFDNASRAIGAVAGLAAGLASRTYRLNIGIVDHVTGPLGSLLGRRTVSPGSITLGGGGSSGMGGGIVIVNGAGAAAPAAGGGASLWEGISGAIGTVDSVLSIADTLELVEGTKLGGKLLGLGTNLGGKAAGLGTKAAQALGYGKHFAISQSAAGLGAIGGGIAAGATLISAGGDFYNASQTTGDESTYHNAKGWTKVGGVGAGALIGTMIFPGVGTLIGAGIGGLVGSVLSDPIAEGISGLTEEERERRAALEPAMAGYSDSSKNAIINSKMTVEQLENIKKTKMDEWYSGVSLSMQEVADRGQTAFQNVLGRDTLSNMNEYERSLYQTSQAMGEMESSLKQLGSRKYELGEGESLKQQESLEYASRADSYVSSAQAYTSGQRYEAELSSNIIFGEGSTFGAEADTYWSGVEGEIAGIRQKLHETIQEALSEDSDTPFVIDDTEQEVIQQYMDQITQTQNKIDEAGQKAQMATLKSKYADPNKLDQASKAAVLGELDEMERGAIDKLYEHQANALKTDYLMTGGANEQSIMNSTQERIAELQQGFSAEKLPYLTAGAEEVANEMRNSDQIIMDALGNNTFMEGFKDHYLDSFNGEGMYNHLLQSLDGEGMVAEIAAQAETAKEQLLVMKEAFAQAGEDTPDWLEEGLIKADQLINLDNIDLTQIDPSVLFEQIAGIFESGGDTDFAEIIRGRLSDGTFDGVLDGAKENIINQGHVFSEGIVSGIEAADMSGVQTAADGKKIESDGMIQTAFSTPVNVTQDVNVDYIVNYGPFPSPMSFPSGGSGSNDNGTGTIGSANGRITGSTKQLSWLAEEGWPEAVIPFNPARRGRAIGLWQETGKRLGVLENAAGGIVGDYGRVSVPEYSGTGGGSSGGGSAVTIASGAVQISVQAAEGQSVTQVIEENLADIGAQVAEVIVQKLEPQFENTPMRAG